MHVLLIKILMNFKHLLSFIKKHFDIIAIKKIKKRIAKQVFSLHNLNLNNYSFQITPTETSTGGVML